MTDQYNKSSQITFGGMTDATSLQASDCGNTLCSSQGGKIASFGQAVAPANLLVQQVDKKVKQTIDTYGLNGSASLASVGLQQSLESKLQALLPTGGLTMFIKGWKRKATPLGRLYCQLAVSVRPIEGRDYGLWPTARASTAMNDKAETVLRNVEKCGYKGKLEQAAALWHTPRTMMIEETPENFQKRMNSKRSKDRGEHATPNLAVQALWATPAVRDHKDTGDLSKSQVRKDGKERNDTLGRQAYGSIAQTESKGSLNPVFPCWLMGIPNEWVSSIVQGMQSYRKSPQDSYKPLVTPSAETKGE